MGRSIQLTEQERKSLLRLYRSQGNARSARQAHVVLLRAEGWTWEEIRQVTFSSNDFIAETLKLFQEHRLGIWLDVEQSSPPPEWLLQVVQWMTCSTPQEFGYFRTRWTCEMLAEVLAWETGQRVSAETVRRGLHRMGFVWRRPRPTVGPVDPEYERKLAEIQALLESLPEDETAVFQDEVDVNLNPKIGSAWMDRGQQAEVVTPGNNVKRYVSGSLHWRTGRLIVSAPTTKRNSEQFLHHLDDLRRSFRSYRVVHVICDNASFHHSRIVREYLEKWSHRIRVHFLPRYAPETNPIERVWWHLHETITRNHRCKSIQELLDEAYQWFESQSYFEIETQISYPIAA